MSDNFPPASIKALVGEVAQLLHQRKETVSVAETAAGGIISASILSTPGASKIFKGGLTLYTLESRMAFAGWTQQHIDNYHGPTPAVVAGIADNVRAKLGSTFTICESGTAGPTGGQTRNRTPGYCALAVSSPGKTFTREIETGSEVREDNMLAFAVAGLLLLKDILRGDAKI